MGNTKCQLFDLRTQVVASQTSLEVKNHNPSIRGQLYCAMSQEMVTKF